ncbi:MAG: CHC2 zinc finger domain-containing protein [Waddliaceae bacterium]
MKSDKWKLDAAKIKECIPPYDFYMREQDFQRFGYRSGKWAVAGLCPFHDDGSAGSFKVNYESGAFNCFSCGEKGGDIITYMQKKYNLSFREALEKLGNEWRIL